MAYKYLNDDGLKAYTKKVKGYISSLLPTKSVTYAELKALRDAGKLLAGRKYRITDFVTTTTQVDTRSAGHAFDIIVVADDESTLNENARAILHKGDTYFAGCKLGAWELKYCLDNDTTRFAWADATNGKGVVWWMKDEWDNECYYDFKNIQYKRWKVTGATVEKYATQIAPFIFSVEQPYFYGILDANNGNIYPNNAVIDENTFDWFYTFAARVNAEYFDASLKEYLTEEEKAQVQEYGANNNSKVYSCVIGKNTQWYYTDDYYSSDKMFLNNAVVYNEKTILLDDAGVVNDVIGGYAYGIRCGNNCSSWTCGNGCSYWTCGNDCYSWTCGNDCDSWTCGNYCNSWTCGNDCLSWTCGNNCLSWTCGNNCSFWTCGNYCNSWTCGNEVQGTKVLQDNVSYFHLDDGVSYVTIKSSGTPTMNAPLKNFKVKAGIKGASLNNKLAIVIDATSFPLGSNYEWTIAKNSSGAVKQYCEADLIN